MHASVCPKARTRACCDAVAKVLESRRIQVFALAACTNSLSCSGTSGRSGCCCSAAALSVHCVVLRISFLPVLLVISLHERRVTNSCQNSAPVDRQIAVFTWRPMQ